jgi:primosomal protein N' (replication factor Y)
MKAGIRSQHFTLQKLGPDAPRRLLDSGVVDAARAAAQLLLTHTSAVLDSIAPSFLFTPTSLGRDEHPAPRTRGAYIVTPLQASTADRLAQYKNIVRESFVRNESVYILVPTREDVLSVSEALATGIASYIIPLHSSLSEKIKRTRWQDALTRDHPVVVVMTGSFLALPRHDLGTVIIERESASSYTRIERPHINLTVVAECLAQTKGLQLILGDSVLTARTHARIQAHELDTPYPLTTKAKGGTVELVEFKKHEDAKLPTEDKTLFAAYIYETITTTLAHNSRVLILSPRAGFATTVLCRDCGTRALCPHCTAGYRLHTNKSRERVLACMRCGHSEQANTVCTTCGSWKLASFGLASEMLASDMMAHFPAAHIVDLHSKHSAQAKPKAKAHADITIIPTNLLSSTTAADVGLVIIPSLESLLSAPTADADIQTLRTIARARELSPRTLVHTRMKHLDDRIHSIVDGQIADFIRADLSLRESLRMPPYTRDVSLRVEGSKQTVVTNARLIIDTLKKFSPKPQPQLIRESATTLSHTTTLSFPGALPPDLIELIHTLPPSCRIQVS